MFYTITYNCFHNYKLTPIINPSLRELPKDTNRAFVENDNKFVDITYKILKY